MGVVMNLHADPDASPALTVGFASFTVAFAALTLALYRPLHADRRGGADGSSAGPSRVQRSLPTGGSPT